MKYEGVTLREVIEFLTSTMTLATVALNTWKLYKLRQKVDCIHNAVTGPNSECNYLPDEREASWRE